MSSQSDPASDRLALVHLGLKLLLLQRGEYIADYLTEERFQRFRRRLLAVEEAAEEAGLELNSLVERLEQDDEAAELLEEVIDVAKSARYEPKLAYLGRCLAAAFRSDDDAIFDTTWMKMAAIRDLESVHVQLLHAISEAQKERAASGLFGRSPHTANIPVMEQALIRRKPSEGRGIQGSIFYPVMAILLRNGLVVSEQEVDVDIDIEVNAGTEEIEGSPSARTSTLYRLSHLGVEILEELRKTTSDGLDSVHETNR